MGAGDAVPRRAGEALVAPLVYGSIAFFLGKKATDQKTHKWSIFVRGLEDEDMSYFIKKVVFTLHPSCEIPVVVCEQPPYAVTQTGWGEFDVRISIHMRDEAESVVDINHFLQLYHLGLSSKNNATILKKPVVVERYEELVFHQPSEAFANLLLSYDTKTARKNVSDPELRECFTKISEVESMKAIMNAQALITAEIDKTRDQLLEAQPNPASCPAPGGETTLAKRPITCCEGLAVAAEE
ncbi:Transcription initiation factor TFIID subunit 14b (GAS 41-like protein) (Protein AF-9 homolog a) (TBP-associated factor 14b) (AtTAF14b) [Durusdinium trenchii]|uniref:Transcription initiation factor TFIID subunit 14b (GAS 41-like protein) (Protein AF-9 homolog a) (TBP-associated factor 14b) (AtTAF14b) n=1 Tax=Durusdinium trenchii TaxID=1381693 RepID=A0ABP0HLF2_9DINO